MRRDDPRRCARLLAHVRTGRLRDCAPEIQAQVDGALDWMSDRLPFPLVAPEAVLDDLRDWADWMHFDESSWLVAHLAAETRRLAEEILSFSEDQRYVRDDDGEYAPAEAAAAITAATGMSLYALRASLDRGRPTEERRAVRVALARVVWDCGRPTVSARTLSRKPWRAIRRRSGGSLSKVGWKMQDRRV